mgnify:CR=1 FL=1
MPKPTKGKRLGGSSSHEDQIISNLIKSLIEHEKIETTITKAKIVKPYAEKVITKAKKGDLNSIRMISRKIRHKNILGILLNDIAPVYKNRNGGYTRIIKLGFRDNDRASVALIEFVDMEGANDSEFSSSVEEKNSE